MRETIIDGWVVSWLRDVAGLVWFTEAWDTSTICYHKLAARSCWIAKSGRFAADLAIRCEQLRCIYYSTKVRVSDRVAEILILGR